MREHLFLALDVLGSLPSTILGGVGEQVMTGIVTLLKSQEGLVKCDIPNL
jgi:hypothetical protein